jgi:hypothetical protein
MKNRLLPTMGPVYDRTRQVDAAVGPAVVPQLRIGEYVEQFRARFANWPQPDRQIVRNIHRNKRSE